MIMDCRGLLLGFAILFHQQASEAFVTVSCKPESVGHIGQPSVVQCVVERSEEAKDAQISMVYWTRGSEKLLVFEEGSTQPKPGYTFADPSWKENMNISLLIRSTAMTDGGEYKCFVQTDSGQDSGHLKLSVTAKYRKPNVTEERSLVDGQKALVCSSNGGFPKSELIWYNADGEKVDGEMNVKQEENGLYTLTNKLKMNIQGTYTCKVVGASGEVETSHDPVTFGIPEKVNAFTPRPQLSTTKIVAPLVVIGSLIVGLLLVVILYRKRRAMVRRPSAAPLMGSHALVENNTTCRDDCASEDETLKDE